jgi:hypothetical protein
MKNLTLVGSFVALALTAFAPSIARADHALYAGVGAGFVDDFAGWNNCCAVHGHIQGEFGIHFDHEDTGFVLAFEGWGTFGPDYAGFTGGARFGYDIEVHTDHSFQLILRPSGFVGFGLRDWAHDNRGPFGDLTLQPAFEGRFVFANRLIALWLRPIAFDIMYWWEPGWFNVGYQFVGGIDFQF